MAREREILSRFIGQSASSSHPLCSAEVNKIRYLTLIFGALPYWIFWTVRFHSTIGMYTYVGFYHKMCVETHILE